MAVSPPKALVESDLQLAKELEPIAIGFDDIDGYISDLAELI